MNWSDYEAIWKQQELPVGTGADPAALKATFETKRRKLAATLFVRDIVEASAGVIVAAAFALKWWNQGKAGWPISLAIILVLGVTGVFIKERIRTHRLRLGAEAPLMARLEAEIAELRHQRRLLLSVLTWYVAPCVGAILIVLGTGALNARTDALAPRWLFEGPVLGAYLASVGGLAWFAQWLNRRAVRKQIEPRLAELEKLHRDLLSSSES